MNLSERLCGILKCNSKELLKLRTAQYQNILIEKQNLLSEHEKCKNISNMRLKSMTRDGVPDSIVKEIARLMVHYVRKQVAKQ